MKQLFLFCAGIAGCLLLAGPMAAQPGDDPGPEHKALARRVGEYATVTKLVFQPDAKPMESKGTAKIKTLLGGRFLSEENEGSLLGQTFTGLRLWGYNNGSKKYEATWAYTGSTSLMALTGSSSDEGKTIAYAASFDAGGAKMNFEIVTKQIDDDHFSVKMTAKTADGKPGAMFETMYTRKK